MSSKAEYGSVMSTVVEDVRFPIEKVMLAFWVWRAVCCVSFSR